MAAPHRAWRCSTARRCRRSCSCCSRTGRTAGAPRPSCSPSWRRATTRSGGRCCGRAQCRRWCSTCARQPSRSSCARGRGCSRTSRSTPTPPPRCCARARRARWSICAVRMRCRSQHRACATPRRLAAPRAPCPPSAAAPSPLSPHYLSVPLGQAHALSVRALGQLAAQDAQLLRSPQVLRVLCRVAGASVLEARLAATAELVALLERPTNRPTLLKAHVIAVFLQARAPPPAPPRAPLLPLHAPLHAPRPHPSPSRSSLGGSTRCFPPPRSAPTRSTKSSSARRCAASSASPRTPPRGAPPPPDQQQSGTRTSAAHPSARAAAGQAGL